MPFLRGKINVGLLAQFLRRVPEQCLISRVEFGDAAGDVSANKGIRHALVQPAVFAFGLAQRRVGRPQFGSAVLHTPFQFVMRLVQGRLGALALSDVPHEAKHPLAAAAQPGYADLDLDFRSVLPAMTGLESVCPGGHDSCLVPGHFFGAFGGFKVGNPHLEQLLAAVASQATIGVVDVNDRASGVSSKIQGKESIHRRGQDGAVEVLALLQGLLGPDALQRARAVIRQGLKRPQVFLSIRIRRVTLDREHANGLAVSPHRGAHDRG